MLKEKFKGIIIGVLIGTMITATTSFAVNTTTLYDVVTNGIRIVIDGKQLNPTDANGNPVEPMIYNGTTYLPVRAVANAFSKAVYWDGSEYTVYLGDMDGKLENPTTYLKDMESVGRKVIKAPTFTDNYENVYSDGIIPVGLEYVLNSKYSRFKGVFYIPKGTNTDYGEETYLQITADDKIVYKSPIVNKTSKPIDVDVDVKGCNIFKITITHNGHGTLNFQPCIAEAGFYQ